MISENIHYAIKEVRLLKNRIVEKQQFQGFSAAARASGGVIALIGACIMALPFYPESTFFHVVGWGLVSALSFFMNYGALLLWFTKLEKQERKNLNRRAVYDTLILVFIGGVLTFGLIQSNSHNLLFGSWMLIFGVMNYIGQNFLPRVMALLGIYYILCGSYLIFFETTMSFYNPWPMGVVFFIGESIGGYIFYKVSRSKYD